MRGIGGFDEYIRIADIKLQKSVNTYVIDSIDEVKVKKYIAAPAQSLLRAGYMDYFFKAADIRANTNTMPLENRSVDGPAGFEMPPVPEIATGTLEVPLGSNARKGDIRYSGEVIHGLGKGNVYVQIGFESVSEDKALGVNARSTIYGNADLFQKEIDRAPNVETAVKVLNDRGSFVVAAKLLQNVDYLVLTYRWVAIKFPSGETIENPEDFAGKSIIPETPTVVLDTKESHFFSVRFENMSSCSIVYELTEENSGEITSDGIYTAPNREGVFEIRIYCADMPIICAYAYAIVKKKGMKNNDVQS